MSTKSTIVDEINFEIFEESSEPQMVFGQFVGNNIYFIIEIDSFLSIKMEGQYLFIKSKSIPIPSLLKFWGGDIIKAQYDSDGLLIVFKGGSRTAAYLRNQDYSIFNVG